jgi:hypothetical protein
MTAKLQEDVLRALLGADSKPEKDLHMKRLGVNFRIQALDGKTINKIQEQCSHYVGKGSKREKVMDEEQFGALVIQKACLIPDWSAKELIDKYGTPTEAILGILLAGEIAKLSTEIMDISGFNSEEDEVKN